MALLSTGNHDDSNQKEKIKEHETAIREYNRKTKLRDDLRAKEKELEKKIKDIEAKDMRIKNEITNEIQHELKTKVRKNYFIPPSLGVEGVFCLIYTPRH